MVKYAILTFIMGLALAVAVWGNVMAQSATVAPSPVVSPTGVMPSSPPSTGRG